MSYSIDFSPGTMIAQSDAGSTALRDGTETVNAERVLEVLPQKCAVARVIVCGRCRRTRRMARELEAMGRERLFPAATILAALAARAEERRSAEADISVQKAMTLARIRMRRCTCGTSCVTARDDSSPSPDLTPKILNDFRGRSRDRTCDFVRVKDALYR
jgi:hypothetical protein